KGDCSQGHYFEGQKILLLTQEIKTIRILTHLAAEFKLRAQNERFKSIEDGFKANPLAALHQHLQSTQSVLEKPPQKKETGKKGKKNKNKKEKKKKKKPKASTGSQTMEE
ncbi:hypothetical protein Tco_1089035, partial [Tanacetum coccineum]